MAKDDFQYAGWNSNTLQCGTITTLISSGDCTLPCGMWLWNRDSEFTKWQHPAMWYVALGWHAIKFAHTSAVLEFYTLFPFPHITAVDMSFCTSLRNFIHIGPPSAENNDVMSIFKIADFRDPVMGSLKRQCATSYRSSIDTMALNCYSFWEHRVFFAFWRQTDGRTDGQTDGQLRRTKPLSLSRAAAQ